MRSLVPGSNKPPAIDKISVLRLTSTFLKLQDFLKESEFHYSMNGTLRTLYKRGGRG